MSSLLPKHSSFRWEGTVFLRKIVVVSIGVFGTTLGRMQVHLTLVMVFITIMLTALIKPYDGISLQRLEIASLSALFVTLWVASVFSTYPYCEMNGKSLAWCEFLAFVVAMIDVAVVVVIAVFFLRAKGLPGCLDGCFGTVKMRARFLIESSGRWLNDVLDRMHGSEAVAKRQQIRIRRRTVDAEEGAENKTFVNPTLEVENRGIEMVDKAKNIL